MALAFNSKNTAILCGNTSDGRFFAVPGVTTASTTPENAAAQVNKLFAIGGLSVVADTNMKRVKTEEVADNV